MIHHVVLLDEFQENSVEYAERTETETVVKNFTFGNNCSL
jgi:hypothetical protein